MEAANTYLRDSFVPAFNARFGRMRRNLAAHSPPMPARRWTTCCASDVDNCVSWSGRSQQILAQQHPLHQGDGAGA
jgi:hypothetical protein